MRILLLEDDLILSKEIKNFLQLKNVECDLVFDGDLFFRQIKHYKYDLFLLDINVPKMNGLDVCQKIRDTNPLTPIIMVTAYGEIDDKIDAFEKGADDYLVKPFHLEELIVRISALIRRSDKPQKVSNIISIEDISIDIDEKSVKRNGVIINLTPKEYKLLIILVEANGRVMSKQDIADKLWDFHIETNQNSIEVYINFLRNKIDKNQPIKLIHTKIGFGYYLKAE
jgi:DNA-binding response OmpR family regulator